MTNRTEVIRQDLQHGTGELLQNRRKIVVCSLFSSAILGGIALYQIGVFKSLPDPPLQHFNANKVNGSEQAYSIGRTPDALLGMASYAVTACLAGMGPQNRWEATPLVPIAMLGKSVMDSAMAGKLSIEQWTKYRAFSLWSLMTSAATFVSLRYAIPEAIKALRNI